MKTVMKPQPLLIEDIEARRQEQGIDDVLLRSEIGHLRRGDQVKLTLITGPLNLEMIQVAITNIRDGTYRGKLISTLPTKCPVKLVAGTILSFQATHIHSIIKAS